MKSIHEKEDELKRMLAKVRGGKPVKIHAEESSLPQHIFLIMVLSALNF